MDAKNKIGITEKLQSPANSDKAGPLLEEPLVETSLPLGF